MNLEKRVEQLERRNATGESMFLIICAFQRGDEAEPREVIGYGEMGRDARSWTREPGESVEALRARVEAQLATDGKLVGAVCEKYADEPAPR